jgi:hypothetical protein
MKHKIFVAMMIFALISCRSRPHKAELIETKLDQAAAVSGQQQVGVKNGDMVVLDKVQMSEKLRDLQNSVYALEDRVYGTRKLGTLGLYGELKACKRKEASRQFGGNGTLVWSEPLDRVTDKEDEMKVGLDEKKDLVGVSEEFLKDRLQRFQGYKAILQKRADDYQHQIETCKGEISTRELDTNQSSKVMVQEMPKASVDRAGLNEFMCSYVKSGASLQQLMMACFAKGWLALSDFRFEQNLLPVTLKDSKGETRDNALLFNGWKLAFDKSPVTAGDLFAGKDARLVAWAYEKRSDVLDSTGCLKSPDGAWNP